MKCFFLLCLLSAGAVLQAETAAVTPAVSPDKHSVSRTDKEDNSAAANAPLPSEYRGVQLGMPVDAVKETLKKDSIFGYRGDRDISLLPTENRILVETAGIGFISRSWFQFYEDHLYTMIFRLNTDEVDYYSIYSSFCTKYGEPLLINPKRAVWEDGSIRVVIERPLTVKYIDLTVFNKLIEQDQSKQAHSVVRRKDFVDSF